MNIKDLMEKFKDTPPDRTLERDLIIEAKPIKVPEKGLSMGYIILEDSTGVLEAVASKSALHEYLKTCVNKQQMLKLKGRLDKTEFGNIAFSIEEVIN